MPSPGDVHAALQHVAATALALLRGDGDPLVHSVTTRDLHRFRRAADAAGLFQKSTGRRGGRGGSHPPGFLETTELPEAEPTTSTSLTTASRSEAGTPRTTWLTDPINAYTETYGEPPTQLAIKRMGRTFKELEITHPRPEVHRRYRNYIRATPLRFYSVESFAEKWPAWATSSGGSDPRDARPGESADDYIARVAR